MLLGCMFCAADSNFVRLYCSCNQSWWTTDDAAIAIYAFSETQANADWPGDRMMMVDGVAGLWTAEVDTSLYKNVVFVRVNPSDTPEDWGAKTHDLTIPTDGKNLYTITSTEAVWGDTGVEGVWSVYDGSGTPNSITDEGVSVYTVVGNAVLLGSEWDVSSTATDMNPSADSISWTFTLPSVRLVAATVYEYKIVADHSWENVQYPADGNYSLSVPRTGTYEVTFTLIPTQGCTANYTLIEDEFPNFSYSKYAILVNHDRFVPCSLQPIENFEAQYLALVELEAGDTIRLFNRERNSYESDLPELEQSGESANFSVPTSSYGYIEGYYVCNVAGCYSIYYKRNHSRNYYASSAAAESVWIGTSSTCHAGEDYASNKSVSTVYVSITDGQRTAAINAYGRFVEKPTETLPIGSTIEIETFPDEGYVFVEWSDGTIENKRRFDVMEDLSLTASVVSTATLPIGLLVNNNRFIRTAKSETTDYGYQNLIRAQLTEGDTFVVYNSSTSQTVNVEMETGGLSGNFSSANQTNIFECNVSGCYNVYVKKNTSTLSETMYISEGAGCSEGEAWGESQSQSYYLIGSTAELGSWDLANSLPMENNYVSLELPAGSYAFKVLTQRDSWDNSFGYASLAHDCSSANVRGDESGNIAITMSESGLITVGVPEYNKVCVTGSFVNTDNSAYLTTGVTPTDCGGYARPSGEYTIGTTVELEANITIGGWMFDKWSDNESWDNPRTITLTQDTIITAIFSPGEYGIIVNGNRFYRGTFTERLDGSYVAQFLASVALSAGDMFQIINLFHSDNSRWCPQIEEGGLSGNFSTDSEYNSIVCNTAGCYDIYIKIHYGQSSDVVYISGGSNCSDGEPDCPIASGKCGAEGDSTNVMWELTCDTILFISGTGAMADYQNASEGMQGNPSTNPDSGLGLAPTRPNGARKAPASSNSTAPWADYADAIKAIQIGEGITRIGNNSFSDCSHVSNVSLPSTLAEIGEYAFEGTTNLDTIYCYNPAPATISSSTFSTQSTTVLIVPSGSVEQYKAVQYWSEFSTIQTTDGGDTDEIVLYGTTFDDWAQQTISSEQTMTYAGMSFTANNIKIVPTQKPTSVSDASLGYIQPTKTSSVYLQTEMLPFVSRVTYVHSSGTAGRGWQLESSSDGENWYAFNDNDPGCEAANIAETREMYVYMENVWLRWVPNSANSGTNIYLNEITIYGKAGSSGDEPQILASGDCAADGSSNVTWLLTGDSILTIGGNGAMADYNDEMDLAPWYVYKDAYHSVYIAAGVTNVGNLAFRQSTNLRYVDLASTVTSLGNYSFYDCPALHVLNLPESVTSVGDNSPFGGYTTITSAIYNSTVFVRLPQDYSGEYTVAEGTSVIASDAFKGCNMLTSVVLPSSVTTLAGSSTFENCSALGAVNIPEGVTTLGLYMFSGCSSLQSVDLPASVTSLGSYCFGECAYIESITCRATTPPEANGSTFAGVNYMIPIYVPQESLEQYPAAEGWSGFTDYRAIDGGSQSCTIASGKCGADADSTNVTWVLSCDSVLTISGTGAMRDNDGNGASMPGEGSFDPPFAPTRSNKSAPRKAKMMGVETPWTDHRHAIKIVRIEEGVTHVGDESFSDCQNITEVSLPESLTSIGSYAFANTTKMHSIVIPASVTEIEDGAFNNCTNLDTIYCYNPSPATIYSSTFSTQSTSVLMVPYGSVEQYKAAANWSEFSDIRALACTVVSGECGAQGGNLIWSLSCDSILTISGEGSMPSSYSANATPWYEYGQSIKHIIIDEGVTKLALNAFYNAGTYANYPNVRTLSIPSTLGAPIETSYFYGCPLTSVTINSDTIVGRASYSSGSSLQNKFGAQVEEYIIGDAVRSIANFAFYNQSPDSLRTISLPEGLESIGNWAFGYIEHMTSVSVPSTVQTIGTDAFASCTNLRSIELGDGLTTINGQAFWMCDSLTHVTCYAMMPPTLNSTAFDHYGTLSVPCEAMQSYREADYWKNFSISSSSADCETATAMAGTYRVGGDNADFTYLHEATEAIRTNGLEGDVTLLICGDIAETANAGITNPSEYSITIRPDSAVKRTISFGSSPDNYGPSGHVIIGYDMIEWAATPTKNIVIDGSYEGEGQYLEFQAGSTGGVVLVYYGNVTNSVVRNCRLINARTTSSSNYVVHFRTEQLTSSSTNATKSDNAPIGVGVEHCYLEVIGTANSQGVYFNGSQSATSAGKPTDCYIRNCEVVAGMRGVFFYGANNATIEGNTFRMPNAPNGYMAHAIFGNAQTGIITIRNNRFIQLATANATTGEYGIRGINANGGADVWIIENNTFAGLDATAAAVTDKSIQLHYVRCFDSCVVRHNTFHLPALTYKPATSLVDDQAIACIYMAGTKSYIVENNIFVSEETEAYNSLICRFMNDSIRNNVFFHRGGNAAVLADEIVAMSWEEFTANGANAGSVWVEPQFANAAEGDLSLTKGYSEMKMRRLDNVLTDIEGTQRNDPTYAGAYEFGGTDEPYTDPNANFTLELSNDWTFVMIPGLFGMQPEDVTVNGEVTWATYNGSVRAMGASGWELYDAASVHMCSQALIARAKQGTATLNIVVPNQARNKQEIYVPVSLHPATYAQNANWNFLGNPYPFRYDIMHALEDANITSPIAVWNGIAYDFYTPGLDEYVLQPFEAFFIQMPENGSTNIPFSAEYTLGD